LASPARQASTTRASRLGWTKSPINSIEVRRGRLLGADHDFHFFLIG
jgi:hypothetical protein